MPKAADCGRDPSVKRLEGVSVLISGGASGVGRATAHRFAEEGAARITLFDQDASRIADVAAELAGIGAETRTVVGDVANPPDCQRAVDEAVRGDGRLDVLVSNAGADSIHDFLELELDEWYRIMDINLTASF
ncbi:MAG: SDR family oxidoreductase, partial [Acidimicrobiaceae bacterium]|nr:SDR family oxidoreductase [Acidimicrobiaceae bacterium]